MTDRLQLLIEADRRGLLPPDKQAALREYLGREANTEIEKPSALERLGRGVADVTEGIGQMARQAGERIGVVPQGTADAYTKEKTYEQGLYERGRGKDAGIDLMRIAGNVGATLPVAVIPGAGAASLGARMASGAAQGAAASGVMFTPEGESKLTQTGTGAVFGALAPAAIEGVKRAFGNVVAKFTPVNNPQVDQQLRGQIVTELKVQGVDPAQLTNDVVNSLVVDAKQALKANGKLDPAQMARKADIQAVGGTPYRAAITRDPRDWQRVKNLRGIEGVGDDIVKVEQQNAAALTNNLSGMAPRAGTDYQVGQKLADAVTDRWLATGDDVSAAYDLARRAVGNGADLPREQFATKAIQILDDYEDVIPGPISRRLKQFGIDAFGVGEPTKAFTVQEGDELLKLVNKRWKKAAPDQKEALTELRNALKEAVLSVGNAGNDSAQAFRSAWQQASQRFSEFEARPIQRLINGQIPPEKVPNALISSSIDDLRQVKKTIDNPEAWDGLKRNVLDGLLLKATGAASVEDVAGKPFSGVKFNKALEAIEPEKLHILFTPDEVAKLRQLQRASKYLTEEVPFSDVNYSKTTAAIVNVFKRLGLSKVANAITANVRGDFAAQTSSQVPVTAARPATPKYPVERFIPGAAAVLLNEAGQ